MTSPSTSAAFGLASMLAVLSIGTEAAAGEPTVKRVPAEGLTEVRLLTSNAPCVIDTGATSNVEIEVDETSGPPLTFARDDDRLVIKWHGRQKIRVKLPPALKVELLSAHGPVTVSGRFRRLTARNISGDVKLDVEAERVEVRTISGAIEARVKTPELTLESVNGEIEVDGARGDVKLHTVSGAVRLKHFEPGQLQIRSVSGDIRYSGKIIPEGDFCIRTISADVHLYVEGDARFEVDGRSRSGMIHIERELNAVSDSPQRADGSNGRRPRHARRVHYVVGKGGARVQFESFSGTLHISR